LKNNKKKVTGFYSHLYTI